MGKLTTYAGVAICALSLFTIALADHNVVQVRLESTNDKRVSKRLAHQITRVRLLNRLSKDPCTAGQDWGYSGRTLWVDDGCRAVFEVRYRDGKDHDGKKDDGMRKVFTVASDNGQRKRVWVGKNANVQLSRKLSDKPCVRGSTWGYDGTYLWVTRGCRATFAVSRR